MQDEINNFLDEFTDNYSELFVEVFMIKYQERFNIKDINYSISKVQSKLYKKIKLKFLEKLK